MTYVKPMLNKVSGDLPPVTVNFAPPSAETSNVQKQTYQEELSEKLYDVF